MPIAVYLSYKFRRICLYQWESDIGKCAKLQIMTKGKLYIIMNKAALDNQVEIVDLIKIQEGNKLLYVRSIFEYL